MIVDNVDYCLGHPDITGCPGYYFCCFRFATCAWIVSVSDNHVAIIMSVKLI